jgi:pheromone shutdown protein TraB
VVLELCDKRFISIKKALAQQEENITLASDRTLDDVLLKWSRGVRKAYIKRGLRHAIGSAVISSLYLVQEVVSGFEPGTEFKTAIVACERMCSDEPEIVNGDDDVNYTIRRLTTASSFLEGLSLAELGRQMTVLKRAAVGQITTNTIQNPEGSQEAGDEEFLRYIRLSDALGHVWLDLFKTLFPFVVLAWPIANVLVDGVHTGDSIASGGSGVFIAIVNTVLCIVVPLVWLRIGDIIVSSRDDVLATSIMETCRRHEGKTVVAVLGLLHCNGVIAKVSSENPSA